MNPMRCAALFAAFSIASVAPATVLTLSYKTTVTFAGKDIGAAGTSEIMNFTLTYDPTSASGASITNYTSSSSLASFQAPVSVQVDPTDPNGTSIQIFKQPNGSSVLTHTNDFYSDFYVDPNGTPIYLGNGTYGGQFVYATADTRNLYYQKTSFTVLTSNGSTNPGNGGGGGGGSVVPEPASWTMMIAGFGAIGATARRRKVSSRLA